jgi:hypothetical protein
MTMEWPDGLKAGPISQWPGELTRHRQRSKFKAGLRDTLTTLNSELYHLTETRSQRESVEMLIAIPPGDQWRLDGRPRANATPEHPGVIVSLDSKFGHLSYPCDTFTTWQDNLRAVALALEALRKVDRYGVTKRGEQYRGFLAIEATAAPAGFPSAVDAIGFVRAVSGLFGSRSGTRIPICQVATRASSSASRSPSRSSGARVCCEGHGWSHGERRGRLRRPRRPGAPARLQRPGRAIRPRPLGVARAAAASRDRGDGLVSTLVRRSAKETAYEVRKMLAIGAEPREIERALGVQMESVMRALTRAGAKRELAIFHAAIAREQLVLRPPRGWSCRDENCGHRHAA